jgi:crossover junction endodeoxyribonuclease RuvC
MTTIKPIRVLAVDPGYERCGIAVLEKQSGKEVVLHSECVRTSKTLPFSERLLAIGSAITRVIEAHAPGMLAMETLFFTNNAKTAIAVAVARGVITYAAACSGLPLFEYGPGTIKIAVTGVGNADKKQVMQMIPKLVVLKSPDMLDDEYDAIAIGITHLAHASNQRG